MFVVSVGLVAATKAVQYWLTTEYVPVITLVDESAEAMEKILRIYVTSLTCPWICQQVQSQTCKYLGNIMHAESPVSYTPPPLFLFIVMGAEQLC